MNNDFPPHGSERDAIIKRWYDEDEAKRRNGHAPVTVAKDDRFLLFEETAGPSCHNVYIVRGDHGHLVWSPAWRSEVKSGRSYVGVIGQATCIGWADDPPLAPLVRAPRFLGECAPDVAAVETVLLASGIKARSRSTPPPAPTLITVPKHVRVQDHL